MTKYIRKVLKFKPKRWYDDEDTLVKVILAVLTLGFLFGILVMILLVSFGILK